MSEGFDAKAERFCKETGWTSAPGKDIPAADPLSDSALQRRAEAWLWWCAFDSMRAEKERVLGIGQQFERDARKHFDQSCQNLRRAETAESERSALAARVERLEKDIATLDGIRQSEPEEFIAYWDAFIQALSGRKEG